MKKVLVGFVLGIIVGISILFIGNHFFIKKETNTIQETNDNEEKQEEILDIYSDQVQNLYNNVHSFGCSWSKLFDLYEKNKVNLENFQLNAFDIGYTLFLNEKGILNEYNIKELKSFSYNDINTKVKTIFGKKFDLEDKEYNVGCPIYEYDKNTKIYTMSNDGCGCGTGSGESPYYKLYKAIHSKNKIELYESVVYGKLESEDANYLDYYKDANRSQKIDTCYDGELDSKDCIENSTQYKYIYELEDKNYILKDIVKISE